LRIGEDFVGGLDFGKEGSCAFDVAVVAVRVEFERFSAVGFLDPARSISMLYWADEHRNTYSSSVAFLSTPRST
jgi:hypothetical protein